MAGLSRFTQFIFGTTAAANRMSQIGSLAAGTPLTYSGSSITPALAQGNPETGNYAQGMDGMVIGNSSPALQDLNSLFYLLSYQIAYLMERGIPEYDSHTTYNTNDICRVGATLYISSGDSNTSTPPAGAWVIYSPNNPMTSIGDIIYGSTGGAQARLAGNTTSAPQVLLSTGTGSVATAPTWSSVPTAAIADGAVTAPKLAAKPYDLSVTLNQAATTSYTVVSNIDANVVSYGSPVRLGFIGSITAGNGTIYTQTGSGSFVPGYLYMECHRVVSSTNPTIIQNLGVIQLGAVNDTGGNIQTFFPPSSVGWVDFPSAGSHWYLVYMYMSSSALSAGIQNVQFLAYEI